MSEHLPIEPLRSDFETALADGPVVVSSPTGSGKSTLVPGWCPDPVLVVEPRRVACRSLAQRVAELAGTPLGEGVGYWVRDEKRVSEETRVTFATPGVVLRIFEALDGYRTIVLDEFHERGLDVDLLLALLLARRQGSEGQRLVVMSATLAGEQVASHLGGQHLAAEGRQYPVDVHHLPGKTLLPDVSGVEVRVKQALRAAREHPGDVLVFLPGKGEIAACAAALADEEDLEVVELHGGLSLAEQSRAFAPAGRRKVILATNVAETSLTVPGVGVVVDSGLVRRTRYHQGRGFLTLVPVAEDSAEQRAGRAGRTAPGVCYRLWSEAARLEPRTPPEIHRESLIPLLLGAAACGADAEALPFLDPPRPHAVESARAELVELGALDEEGRITPRGERLFGLPLDASLGALLVEAEAMDTEQPGILRDMVDLVSVLAVGRRVFAPNRKGPREPLPADRERAMAESCDAVAILTAIRGGESPGGRRLDPGTRAEARPIRERLERAYDLGPRPAPGETVDRKRLAFAAIAADRRRAHVARRHGKRLAWSHGGTEIELGRESGAGALEDLGALVVLDTMALGSGGTDTRVLATCAMPVPVGWLVEAGLGRKRLGRLSVDKEHGRPVRIVSHVERVYARRVLETTEEVPTGELARQALVRLCLEDRIFRQARREAADRLRSAALARQLAGRVEEARAGWHDWEAEVERLFPEGVPDLEGWLRTRVAELGVESGDDVGLLEGEDLLPPQLPELLRDELERKYPLRLELPDATYELDYAVGRREVTLVQVEGSRKKPPPLSFLPRFAGFVIRFRHKEKLLTLRDRRGRATGAV